MLINTLVRQCLWSGIKLPTHPSVNSFTHRSIKRKKKRKEKKKYCFGSSGHLSCFSGPGLIDAVII